MKTTCIYLAPLLESFFTERLIKQRQASRNTIDSYSTTFELLLGYAQENLKKTPSKLLLEDLDATFICHFLNDLESSRGNTPRTRNVRLAAIHSFFKYVSFRKPSHSGRILRILDIPSKRYEKKPINFLRRDEVETLLQAPNLKTWLGRRDRALMALMVQTGLRVSETIALRFKDIELIGSPHVCCMGKGRKERCVPIRKNLAAVLRNWKKENNANLVDILFPSSRDRTALSRDTVEYLVRKHSRVAKEQLPSMSAKRVTPHVLRHSCAMEMLRSGIDLTVIALWLGHESVQSTQCYLHADLEFKQEILEQTAPMNLPSGRYEPEDSLLRFLEGLKIMPSQISPIL